MNTPTIHDELTPPQAAFEISPAMSREALSQLPPDRLIPCGCAECREDRAVNRLPPFQPGEAQLRYEASKRFGEDLAKFADAAINVFGLGVVLYAVFILLDFAARCIAAGQVLY